MKLHLVMAGLLVALSARAQVVMVGNTKVDLTPVLKWFEEGKNGERPMPHWKEIQIVTVKGKGWGGYKVLARVDGKERSEEIVLQNIPSTLLTVISANDEALLQMAQTEAKIEQVEAMTRDIERKQTRISVWDPAYDINREQILLNNNAIADLQNTYRRLTNTVGFTSEARQSRFLAMHTGRKVGNYEVWDCGRGSRLLTAGN